MKESDLQKKVKDEYRDSGGVAFNVMQASEGGVPDLVGFIPLLIKPEHVGQTVGVFVACEVKHPNGKGVRSPEQVYQVERICRKHGVAGFVASMSDFDELISRFSGKISG